MKKINQSLIHFFECINQSQLINVFSDYRINLDLKKTISKFSISPKLWGWGVINYMSMNYVFLFMLLIVSLTGFTQNTCSNAQLPNTQIVNTTSDYWFLKLQSSKLRVKYNNTNRFNRLYLYSDCNTKLDSIIGQDSSNFTIYDIPNVSNANLCRLSNPNSLQQSFQIAAPQTCEHFIYVTTPISASGNGYYCVTNPITLRFSCDDEIELQNGTAGRVHWFITGPNGFSTEIEFTSPSAPNYPLTYTFPVAGSYIIDFAYDVYNYVTGQWVIAQIPNQNPFVLNLAAPLPPFSLSASDLNPCPGELVTLSANLPTGVTPPNVNICWNPGEENFPANWPFNIACTQLYNNQPQTIPNLIYDNFPHTTTVTFDNGCIVEKTITVTPKTNFVNLQAIKYCGYKIKYQANFTDCASPNFTYNWSFPGGIPSNSTAVSPMVTYSNSNSYSASLTITSTLNGYQYGPFIINNVVPTLNLTTQPPPPLVAINGVLANQNLLECNANNNIFNITNATSFPGYTYTLSNVTGGNYLAGGGISWVVQWDNNPNTLSSFIINSTSPEGCISTQLVRFFPCCGSMQTSELINGGNISTWLAANGITNGVVNTGNNELFINGTVNIDQDVTFLGCQNILMGVNAKLDIQNNKQLSIDNSTLKACGQELWDGIYADNPSEKIIVNNSNLYDAKTALNISSNADYDVNGGRFYDNWVGISFAGMTTQSTTVRSSIFRTTNIMKRSVGQPLLLTHITYQGDFSPQNKGTGIYMRSCIGTQIGDGTSSNLRNEFNDLNCGIFGSASDAFVYNNKFININNTLPLNYTFYTPTAIYLRSWFQPETPRNMLIGSELENHDNEFTNCTWGIYAFESMRGTIAGNQFNNNNIGIYWQLSRGGKNVIESNEMNSQSKYGIYLNNNPNSTFNVKSNKVTCVQNSSTYINTYGIFASTGTISQVQNYYITNNDVNDASIGIKVSGTRSPKVNQNRVSNFPASSISVLNYEIAGIQITACRQPQIFENLVLGNDAFNPKVKGIEIQECTRPILSCDSVVTCGWAYAIRGANTNTFIKNCSAGNSLYGYVYYNGGLTGPIGGGTSNFVEGNKWWNIAAGHTLTTNLGGGVPTNGSLSPWFLPGTNPDNSENPNPNMLNAIGSGSNQLSIQQLNNFNYPNTPCQEINYPFYRLMQEKEWLYKVKNDSAFMNGFDENTKYYLKEQAFESLVDDSAYWEFDVEFAAYLDQLKLGNSGTFEAVASRVDASAYLSAGVKEELDTLLATVLPVRVQESNLAAVLNMYLNSYAIGIDSFNIIDLLFLQNIAQTCYFQGGKAVLLARSMLSSLPNALPTEYADNCIAQYGMQKIGSTAVDSSLRSNKTILIYPSPIQKGTNLLIDNAEGYTLQLSNLMGIRLLEETIRNNKDAVVLPSNIAAGLYIIKLTSNFGETKTQKIIIQ